MAKVRQHNEQLLALIRACGWTYDACAYAVRAVARETTPICPPSTALTWRTGSPGCGLAG